MGNQHKIFKDKSIESTMLKHNDKRVKEFKIKTEAPKIYEKILQALTSL